jgi:hypothetical protein
MIDFEDGARAGKSTALQLSTAPIVRAAILASLPAARAEARSWMKHGNQWHRDTAPYWLEFYDSFEASVADMEAAAARRS